MVNYNLIKPQKIEYYVSIVTMLLPSSLTLILWREFGYHEPIWWYLASLSGLLLILVGTFIFNSIKNIRGYVAFMLFLFIMGYGGGWKFGVIPWIRSNETWIVCTSGLLSRFSDLAVHLLRLAPALLILTVSKLYRLSFSDLFLAVGDVRRNVQPSRLLGVKDKSISWIEMTLRFSAIFGFGTAVFLVLAVKPEVGRLLENLYVLPFVMVIAALNAFNEEFILRAVPLSILSKSVGDENALFLTTSFFSLGHYYGVPYGFTGVLLSGFLGWFIGKSILETRGFLLAWFAHFIPDLVVFGFLLIYT